MTLLASVSEVALLLVSALAAGTSSGVTGARCELLVSHAPAVHLGKTDLVNILLPSQRQDDLAFALESCG